MQSLRSRCAAHLRAITPGASRNPKKTLESKGFCDLPLPIFRTMRTRIAAKEDAMNEKSLDRMIESRFDRLGRQASPMLLELLSASDTPWHEDAEALRVALKRGRENARLLTWVRSQMLFRLTAVERRSIEIYFFERPNYREAAAELGVNPATVYRAVQRGLRKLRIAARVNPPRRRPARTRRRRV
jgi:hypothetical protein